MTAYVVDESRAEAFGQKMTEALNQAALVLMASVGHRTGLFDVLARLPPSRSEWIAAEAGLNERYVREWLGAMVAAGVLEYRWQARTYWLPPEHAGWLTRKAPTNAAASAQWIPLLGSVEDHILAAFRHGKGVPYAAYRRFHEVMAEESAQTVVAALTGHILPVAPGLQERLEEGIDVLDIGCGSGQALLEMAAHYPRSRFTGLDFSEEGIAAARAAARRAERTNVRFAVHDVAEGSERSAYDLVTAFDAIHDQAQPAAVLANVAASLRPQGVFLMQEIAGSGHLHRDALHPLGTFLYTVSCLHCMSVSLANGGPGLGAMWGRETALRMLREAGFRNVRVESLPHDSMNDYYVATLS